MAVLLGLITMQTSTCHMLIKNSIMYAWYALAISAMHFARGAEVNSCSSCPILEITTSGVKSEAF